MKTSSSQSWDPELYQRFQRERAQPFDDLVALIPDLPFARIVDLGCGTGELTLRLAERYRSAVTVGIDSSSSMLSKAVATDRVSFRETTIEAFAPECEAYDLVFTHAALQWVRPFDTVFERMISHMRPGAVFAMQVPRNFDQPSHTIGHTLARESPWTQWLDAPREPMTAPMEWCVSQLHRHGFEHITAMERIYPHLLPTAAHAADWTRGTFLTAYLPRLPDSERERFFEIYRDRLVHALGDETPCLFPFRRMLIVARRRT